MYGFKGTLDTMKAYQSLHYLLYYYKFFVNPVLVLAVKRRRHLKFEISLKLLHYFILRRLWVTYRVVMKQEEICELA